jgi:hypothetical protein
MGQTRRIAENQLMGVGSLLNYSSYVRFGSKAEKLAPTISCPLYP